MTAKTLDDVEAISREFVAGLDRARLGTFAIPVPALEAIDTLQRISTRNQELMMDCYTPALNKVRGQSADAGLPVSACSTELLFWWDISGDDGGWGGKFSAGNDTLEENIKRLKIVYDNPGMHDYFDADVWDVDFIARCIADGIDADLAVSFSRLS